MWLVLILLVGAVAAPFVIEARRPKIGRDQRTGAPGRFARLGAGATYYRWHGPTRGPVVVMIHGLTTPSPVFDALATGVGRLGYRVLTYDLYGRGLSDAPAGEQNAEFFCDQLQELLGTLDIREDVTLLGYSMGGSIATVYAARFPHQVSRVVLLATAGLQVTETRFDRICRTVPYFGDWLFLAFAPQRMEAQIKASTVPSEVDDIVGVQMAEHRRRGFFPAVLSSRRGLLSEKLEQEHRKVSRDDIPVFAIWGARDPVIPIAALGQLAQWNRVAKQEVVADAGHEICYSHASDVMDYLRGMLLER